MSAAGCILCKVVDGAGRIKSFDNVCAAGFRPSSTAVNIYTTIVFYIFPIYIYIKKLAHRSAGFQIKTGVYEPFVGTFDTFDK